MISVHGRHCGEQPWRHRAKAGYIVTPSGSYLLEVQYE